MKIWREFVTRGFQIAQLEERISLLINIFAFLKTWRTRYRVVNKKVNNWHFQHDRGYLE